MEPAIVLTNSERLELLRQAYGRTGHAEDARRARVIVLLAEGYTWDEVMEKVQCGRGFVACWCKRFKQERIAGLFSRHRGQVARVLTPELEARILGATQNALIDGFTHWSTRKLGAHLGVSHMMVARVWRKHGICAPGLERNTASNALVSQSKAADIVGLYLNPPQHVAVFFVEQKTAIQASDATDAVMPISLERVEGQAFERYQHGTLALYSCFNGNTHAALGKTGKRPTSAELVAFLSDIVANKPLGKEIHVIADNFPMRKAKRVEAFLAAHPTVRMHFTRSYVSWLEQLELWFAGIECHMISREIDRSVGGLSGRLMHCIRQCDEIARTAKWKYTDPEPIVSTQSDVTGQ